MKSRKLMQVDDSKAANLDANDDRLPMRNATSYS